MIPERPDPSPCGLVLWEAPDHAPIAARIAVVGDFLPAGALEFPAGLGWREMAENLGGYFGDVDVSFANLESPVDVEGLKPRRLTGIGEIVSAPVAALDYLEPVKCRPVSIANNHSLDFGAAGVIRTREAILRRGLCPLGAGRSLNGTPEVFVWQGPGDVRVGFWAAAKAASDLATRSRAGVEPAIRDRARHAVDHMKKEGARFCIALLHCGCLRTNRPDPGDLRLMDLLVKCDLNVVAASHSHRIAGYQQLEGIEQRPSFCFYGLGSIVSGYVPGPLEREGLVVVAGLNSRGDLVRIEVRAVLLDENGFGAIPSAEASDKILERFEQLSAEVSEGSYEQRFYEDVSKGLVQLYCRDVGRAFREDGIRGLVRKAARLRPRHVRRLVHKVIG